MNGDRTHLPEHLAVALGAAATVAATIAVHHQDVALARQWPTLDSRPSWSIELVVATDRVAPGVLAALAFLLLLRAGHRRLGVAGAVAWILAEGIGAVVSPDLWMAFSAAPLDEGPRAWTVALGSLVVVGLPVLLARRATVAPDVRPPGGRRAALLSLGAAVTAVIWAFSSVDSTLLDDQRWLLLVLAAAVGAAVAAGLPTRRPDGVTLAGLVGVVLAWRLVVLGLGHTDGLGTWEDDAERLAALLTAGLISHGLGRVLPMWRELSRRGPVLWGRAGVEPAVLETSTPAPQHTPRPSRRSLAAATVATMAVVGVVSWQSYSRSAGVTRENLASARAAAADLDAAVLTGGALDPTGTACGDGLWTWCATTSDAPDLAARAVVAAMARHGWQLDDVVCAGDPKDPDTPHAGAPLTTTGFAPVCTARAHRGDVTAAVAAGSMITWIPSAGYPAVDQGRTAVMAGAWASHDDPTENGTLSSRDTTQGAPDGAWWAAKIAPEGWTASLTCTTPDVRDARTVPAGARGCPAGTNARIELRPGHVGALPAEKNAAAVADLGFGLRRLGFRVDVAGCTADGDCRLMAERWLGPGRTQHEFVLGKQQSDGAILFWASS